MCVCVICRITIQVRNVVSEETEKERRGGMKEKKRAHTTIIHSLDRSRREIHVVDTEGDRDLLLCLAAAR